MIAALLLYYPLEPVMADDSPDDLISAILQEEAYRKGDINGDGAVDSADLQILSDLINNTTLDYLKTADVNCDNKLDAEDIVYLENHLYDDGPAPCTKSVQTCTESPCIVRWGDKFLRLTATHDTETAWSAKAYIDDEQGSLLEIASLDLDVAYGTESTALYLAYERQNSPFGLAGIPLTSLNTTLPTPYTESGNIGEMDIATVLSGLSALITAKASVAKTPHDPQHPVAVPYFFTMALKDSCFVGHDFCYQRGGTELNKDHCDNDLFECLLISGSVPESFLSDPWNYKKEYVKKFIQIFAADGFRRHNEEWTCAFTFKNNANQYLDEGTLLNNCSSCSGQDTCAATCLVDLNGNTVEYPCQKVAGMINFNDYAIDVYSSVNDMDTGNWIENNGTTLHLDGNTWKQIELSYNLTASTMLEFDFKSNTQGEIHGIGLDTDLNSDEPHALKIFGTQAWGVRTYDNYDTLSAWKHYVLPVGAHYTGAVKYLFFINDDDAASSGDSYFKNIRIYEKRIAPDAISDVTATAGSGQATLSWLEPAGNGSDILGYKIEYGTVESDSFGTTVIDDATPGIVISGLSNGTAYQFRVYAENDAGTSPASNIALATPKADGQTPWKTNENGSLATLYSDYKYTVGYRFRPLKSGKITKVGGFFEGDKIVKVWKALTGELIASATVSGQSGQWVYADIPPVTITPGTLSIYVVGVYIRTGGTYRYGIDSFSQPYGDIEILSSMRAYGDTMPTGFFSGMMYGQVDIMFEPD